MTYLCDTSRHLVCWPFSVANLHAMAAQLGIKRCWFHGGRHPHYDIPKTRVAEVTARCTVVSQRDVLSIARGARRERVHAVPNVGDLINLDLGYQTNECWQLCRLLSWEWQAGLFAGEDLVARVQEPDGSVFSTTLLTRA